MLKTKLDLALPDAESAGIRDANDKSMLALTVGYRVRTPCNSLMR